MGEPPLHTRDTAASCGKGVSFMLMKTLKRAGIGFLLGMAIGNFIAFITAYTSSGGEVHFMPEKLIEHCGGEAMAFLMQTLLSGLIGLAGFAGMSLYELEEWGMAAAMGTHFGIVMLIFLPCGYLLYWLNTWEDMIIMSVIMAVAYLIVWAIMCAVYRRQVKQLNVLQEQRLKQADKNAA